VNECSQENIDAEKGDHKLFQKHEQDLIYYINPSNKKERYSAYGVISAIKQEWKLSRRQKLILLTGARNDKKLHLGMVIAQDHDNGACQAYLTLLKKLCTGKLSAEYIFNLLTNQDQSGLTLGDYIASFRNHVSLQQYLDLLLHLEQQGVSTRQLFNLISLVASDKWHFGNYIGRFQNRESTRSLLSLLTHFLKNGITAEEILAYLKHQTANGYTIGHAIVLYQDAESVHVYLDFLATLLAQYQYPKDILPLLTLQTIDQWTLIHVIAYYQDADCVLHYIRLIDKLIERGVKCDKADLFSAKNKYSDNAYDLLAILQSADNLYRLICENVFVGMKNKIKLAARKERILEYIMTLPYAEIKQALENALEPGHPLFDFFGIQRGLFAPDMQSGSYAKIKEALFVINFNPIKAINISPLTVPIVTAYKMPAEPINIPSYPPPAYHISASATQMQSVHGLYPVKVDDADFLNPTALSSMVAPSAQAVMQQATQAFSATLPPLYMGGMQDKFVNTAPLNGSGLNNSQDVRDLSHGFVETNLLPSVPSLPESAPTSPSTVSTSSFALMAAPQSSPPVVQNPVQEKPLARIELPTIKKSEAKQPEHEEEKYHERKQLVPVG